MQHICRVFLAVWLFWNTFRRMECLNGDRCIIYSLKRKCWAADSNQVAAFVRNSFGKTYIDCKWSVYLWRKASEHAGEFLAKILVFLGEIIPRPKINKWICHGELGVWVWVYSKYLLDPLAAPPPPHPPPPPKKGEPGLWGRQNSICGNHPVNWNVTVMSHLK